MTRITSGSMLQKARSALQLPSELPPGTLLVGYSMEHTSRRPPIGFSYGNPVTSPSTGFADPILLEREGHLMTVAPTGAGKGVGCIIPALLNYDGPAIVVDPKGENAAITAERRRALGQEIIVLDPMDVVPGPTATFNPLDLIDPRSTVGVDEAAAMAHALLPDSLDDKNRYWINRGRQLLLALILYVITDLPRKERTLDSVRRLANELAGDPKAMMERFEKSRHPEVRTTAGNLMIGADTTLGGIISFTQEGVDFLRGPTLQKVTANTGFNLEDVIAGKPMTIYIVMPPHMLISHGRFLRLWISALMSLIMRRRSRPKKTTLLILDEAAQLGPLDELRTAVTLMRGYGLQTWSFWQDFSQLQLLYPTDWKTMLNNCAVVQAFGPNNLRAAEDVTDILGALSGSDFLRLAPDEMLLQIAGDEAVVAARPNYLTDPSFAGTFARNPLFSADVDPVPRPTIDREYLRAAPPADENADDHTGTPLPLRKTGPARPRGRTAGPGAINPVDKLLAGILLDEVAGGGLGGQLGGGMAYTETTDDKAAGKGDGI